MAVTERYFELIVLVLFSHIWLLNTTSNHVFSSSVPEDVYFKKSVIYLCFFKDHNDVYKLLLYRVYNRDFGRTVFGSIKNCILKTLNNIKYTLSEDIYAAHFLNYLMFTNTPGFIRCLFNRMKISKDFSFETPPLACQVLIHS